MIQNLYKSKAVTVVMASKVPYHVAIILDGNRRYARKLGLQPWKGHEFGIKKLEELFEWCLELGIGKLTLYSFSTENFSRNKEEIDFLFGLFKKKFEQIKDDEESAKKGVRFNVIGRIEMFPEDIKKMMMEAVEKSKNNGKLIVNFALAYGGRQEITDAAKKIVKAAFEGKINPDDVDEELVRDSLYLKDEPDIVIRPGGEKRISNFLLWQSAYSEWFFINKFWPEFEKQDLIDILKEFNVRERRFGR